MTWIPMNPSSIPIKRKISAKDDGWRRGRGNHFYSIEEDSSSMPLTVPGLSPWDGCAKDDDTRRFKVDIIWGDMLAEEESICGVRLHEWTGNKLMVSPVVTKWPFIPQSMMSPPTLKLRVYAAAETRGTATAELSSGVRFRDKTQRPITIKYMQKWHFLTVNLLRPRLCLNSPLTWALYVPPRSELHWLSPTYNVTCNGI